MNSPGLCLARAGKTRGKRFILFQPLEGIKFKALIIKGL